MKHLESENLSLVLRFGGTGRRKAGDRETGKPENRKTGKAVAGLPKEKHREMKGNEKRNGNRGK